MPWVVLTAFMVVALLATWVLPHDVAAQHRVRTVLWTLLGAAVVAGWVGAWQAGANRNWSALTFVLAASVSGFTLPDRVLGELHPLLSIGAVVFFWVIAGALFAVV